MTPDRQVRRGDPGGLFPLVRHEHGVEAADVSEIRPAAEEPEVPRLGVMFRAIGPSDVTDPGQVTDGLLVASHQFADDRIVGDDQLLVGVEPEDPIAEGGLQGGVATGPEVVIPVERDHPGPLPGRDRHRPVGRPRVGDDHLVGDPPDRSDRAPDVPFLVPGQKADAQPARHRQIRSDGRVPKVRSPRLSMLPPGVPDPPRPPALSPSPISPPRHGRQRPGDQWSSIQPIDQPACCAMLPSDFRMLGTATRWFDQELGTKIPIFHHFMKLSTQQVGKRP